MRFILGITILFILLLVGALVAPQFVDWNKYKPQIIEQVKQASGYDITIDGDISVSVIPSPQLKIEKLSVASPRKIEFDTLLAIDAAEVQVSLLPLLQKKVDISKIRFVNPNINIEFLADGTPSWQTDKIAAMSKVKAEGEAVEAVKETVQKEANAVLSQIAVNKLEIKGGRVVLLDHAKKSRQAVDNINVVLKAKSLNGPFNVDGAVTYNEDDITVSGDVGLLPKGNEPLTVKATVGLPKKGAEVSFNGVTSVKAPIEAQGKITVKVKSLKKVSDFHGNFFVDGLMTATDNNVTINDMKLSLDSMTVNGKVAVDNLKQKNPLKVSGSLQSSSVFDASSLMKKKSTPENKSSSDDLKTAGKSTTSKGKELIPSSLTLPMSVDADLSIDLAGLKIEGQTIKGVSVDLNKQAQAMNTTFKLSNVVGQGTVSGQASLNYKSSSKSPKTGQVTYSDPVFKYRLNGMVGDIPSLLSMVAPDLQKNKTVQQFKKVHFDLNGGLAGSAVSLENSVVKLDDMTVGLGGSYQPSNKGRDKAVVDLTIDKINVDALMGVKSNTSNVNAGGTKTSNTSGASKTVKPIEGFSVPLDIKFDVSAQEAIYQGNKISGVRAKGAIDGNKLSLSNLSVNNLYGAAVTVKGAVADTQKLNGLNIDGHIKTSNIKTFLSSLKVDTSKLPSGLSSLEASTTVKGGLDKLNFNSNVKAMSGQLDLSGTATDVVGKFNLGDLTVGLKHPNLVKAIQIVSPDFKGPAGLSQAVNFYTKAVQNGNIYNLSGMKLTLGKTSLGGDLSINTKSKAPVVRGSIKADKILLDQLLGSSKSSGASSSKSSSGGSSSSSAKERWSKAPINMDWMNAVDIDVKLSANSIVHGGWVLEKPSTDLKIANGAMNVKDMRVGLFGGNANVSTNVNASPLSLDVSSTMQGIDLEKLAKALSGGNKLKSSGTVSFSMGVASTGASAYALINALNGKAALNGNNIILEGFDLAKMARGLAVEEKLATSVSSLVNGATSGGQTKFEGLNGDYKIEKGIVNIVTMLLKGNEASITTTGYADLPKWFINTDNEIMLHGVSDLEPFKVKIKGPLDKPSNTFGKNILEDYLAAKLKRKLAKQIPDILGDDVSDKLKKFGILPSDPAPTTPSAPVSNDNAAPAENKPAPAADPLSKILEDPSNAEDAVKDVLKGLF